MATIVNIENYKLSKQQDVSIFDMIFNPVKRRKFYENIDRNYVETEDEKDIFNEMTKRRKGE